MRTQAPFQTVDLEEFDARLLSQAERVVPMYDVARGDRGDRVIGLRHDVDDNPLSFETALAFAEWEFAQGYSSTYYLLHGSHYWNPESLEAAGRFVDLGHEIGLHVNGLAEALLTGDDPRRIVREAVDELRQVGFDVRGCVAHGDQLCSRVGFVNDEMFEESPRPDYGPANRTLRLGSQEVAIAPVSRSGFGFEYDANWLPRANYLSDSGGRWSQSFDDVVETFGVAGQLHILVHPDWWPEAFVGVAA